MIGDVEPQGLCGSGLVDAVAELVKVGLLDASGRFVPDEAAAEIAPALADRLTEDRRGAGVRAAPARTRTPTPRRRVYLSQRDVRELQFAKAAISTGWTLLLEELGLEHARRAAGAAGRVVRHLPLPRRPPSGSGWCRSCRCCASSPPATSPARARRWRCCRVRERAGAQALLEEVRYVELSDRPDFNDRFVDQLAFPG